MVISLYAVLSSFGAFFIIWGAYFIICGESCNIMISKPRSRVFFAPRALGSKIDRDYFGSSSLLKEHAQKKKTYSPSWMLSHELVLTLL